MRMHVPQALQRTFFPRAELGTARIFRQDRFGHIILIVPADIGHASTDGSEWTSGAGGERSSLNRLCRAMPRL